MIADDIIIMPTKGAPKHISRQQRRGLAQKPLLEENWRS
jgi:hypothetical protein